MSKRIPITAAKRVAVEHDCQQIIMLAWDGERTHVVTYGVNPTHCKQAAEGGRKLAEFLKLTPASAE